MPDSSARTLSQEINIWVQTVVILAAFFWGTYTFYVKAIAMPKAAPVNVSLDLQLKPIGTGPVIRQKLAQQFRPLILSTLPDLCCSHISSQN